MYFKWNGLLSCCITDKNKKFDKNLSRNWRGNIWNIPVISTRYKNVRVITDKQKNFQPILSECTPNTKFHGSPFCNFEQTCGYSASSLLCSVQRKCNNNWHDYVQHLLIVPNQWTTQTVKQATYNKPLSDIRACLLRCHHACLFGGTYFNGTRMIRKPTRGESISITIIGRYRANVPTLTRWNVIWTIWRRQSRVRARCRVCQLCSGQDFPQQSTPSRPFVFKQQGAHIFYKNVTAISKL